MASIRTPKRLAFVIAAVLAGFFLSARVVTPAFAMVDRLSDDLPSFTEKKLVKLEWVGTIEAIDGDVLVFDTVAVKVIPETETKTFPEVGNLVKVHAVLVEGIWIATEVELAIDANQTEDADSSDDSFDGSDDSIQNPGYFNDSPDINADSHDDVDSDTALEDDQHEGTSESEIRDDSSDDLHDGLSDDDPAHDTDSDGHHEDGVENAHDAGDDSPDGEHD